MLNYELICAKVISIARLTGNFIRKESLSFDRNEVEYKGLNDLVSYVDKQAERQIVRNLKKVLPNSGFITEEDTPNDDTHDLIWIIDPLDGTTNFIHGIPTFSISIALFENNVPVVGVVYEINRGEMFSAYKNGGAYLNQKAIHVSEVPTLKSSLVATGFPYYQFDKQAAYMNLFGEMMQRCHGLRRIGSAAVDLAYVACGRFDAYFEYNLNIYDVAAGAFIVQEAGGQVMSFSGGEDFIKKRELLATNALVTDEILELMKINFK